MLYHLYLSSWWTQEIMNENLLNKKRKEESSIFKMPATCLVSGALLGLSDLTILWNRWDCHHFRGSVRFRGIVKVTSSKWENWNLNPDLTYSKTLLPSSALCRICVRVWRGVKLFCPPLRFAVFVWESEGEWGTDKTQPRNFPAGPVMDTRPLANARDTGSIPGLGRSHMRQSN